MFTRFISRSLSRTKTSVVTTLLAAALALSQAGCPPPSQAVLSIYPPGWLVPPTSGTASFDIYNDGTAPMSWSAEVVTGADWLSIASDDSGVDDGTLTVEWEENPAPSERTGEIRVTAYGAVGSPKTLQVIQDPGDGQPTSIEGDWGGYWWYSGTEGTVYIAWSFNNGQYTWSIPSAGVSASGNYTLGTQSGQQTIDMTVTSSSIAGWDVGHTYRGWYRIQNGTMYRSQMFETRPAWSSSVLDPQTGIVFVAEPVK